MKLRYFPLFIAMVVPVFSLANEIRLDQIQLPAGFRIGIFTDQVPGARSMTLSPEGTLYVGTRENGKVYAIPGAKSGLAPSKVLVLAQGLNMPNGVAFHDGSLYVAEVNRILRYDKIEEKIKADPDHLKKLKPVVVSSAFPKDRSHGWKFIAFGPDGLLYVPVGAPCNVCERKIRALPASCE